MVRDAQDKTTLYNVNQGIELRQIINALVPFMRTKEDKDKLRKELGKLDGVTKKVVRETIQNKLLPQMYKYLYYGFKLDPNGEVQMQFDRRDREMAELTKIEEQLKRDLPL